MAGTRRQVNPWEWSTRRGFSQAVEVTGPARVLFCSGQTAVGPDGPPVAVTAMDDQVQLALANVATVLENAGMTPADVVKVTLYTTDVDEFSRAYATHARALFGDNLPASTLVGVTRLALPEMKVEIEVTAVADG
jgi:enamine deaminase RidA (YjgF/YER057c/UK114 family)